MPENAQPTAILLSPPPPRAAPPPTSAPPPPAAASSLSSTRRSRLVVYQLFYSWVFSIFGRCDDKQTPWGGRVSSSIEAMIQKIGQSWGLSRVKEALRTTTIHVVHSKDGAEGTSWHTLP